MSFQPKLSVIKVARDASYITLQDTTGAYNASTNPTGYGTPNPVVPTRIGLMWRYWPDTANSGNIISTTMLLQNQANISPSTFGLSGNFTDGVHHFRFSGLNQLTGTFTVTNGSTLVTRTTGTVDFAATFDSLVYYSVEINGKIYYVDFSKTFTTTTFYITETFSGTTGAYSMYLGFTSDLKVLVNANTYKVFAEKVYQMSMADNESQEQISNNSKLLILLQASTIQMQSSNYDKAHNQIVYAFDKYCRNVSYYSGT